jgi:hypothetical protein
MPYKEHTTIVNNKSTSRKTMIHALADLLRALASSERHSAAGEASGLRQLTVPAHDVQPGGTGPTRLNVIVPDRPVLVPPVNV